MKSLALGSAFGLLLVAAVAFGPVQDDPYVSAAARVVGTYQPQVESYAVKERVAAAEAFLASLTEAQRGECLFEMAGEERRQWTNVPPGRDEPGLKFGELSEAQVKLALDLLAVSLSPQGYTRACDVMLADDQLLRGGQPRTGFGTDEFWILLFGTPSTEAAWGLQFDGHHLAYNLTFEGEAICMSPSFLGTQPATFKVGEREVEPMVAAVARGFALVNALNEEQRTAAVVGNRRRGNVAAAGKDGVVPERVGLPCKGLGAEQRELVMQLIDAYVGDLPAAARAARLEHLAEDIDEMHFAWWGPTAAGSDVSYRLQGPCLIIEYACQDLGGDPLQHLHGMYRNPTNEYGGK